MNLSEKLMRLSDDYKCQIRRSDFLESNANESWKTSWNTSN